MTEGLGAGQEGVSSPQQQQQPPPQQQQQEGLAQEEAVAQARRRRQPLGSAQAAAALRQQTEEAAAAAAQGEGRWGEAPEGWDGPADLAAAADYLAALADGLLEGAVAEGAEKEWGAGRQGSTPDAAPAAGWEEAAGWEGGASGEGADAASYQAWHEYWMAYHHQHGCFPPAETLPTSGTAPQAAGAAVGPRSQSGEAAAGRVHAAPTPPAPQAPTLQSEAAIAEDGGPPSSPLPPLVPPPPPLPPPVVGLRVDAQLAQQSPGDRCLQVPAALVQQQLRCWQDWQKQFGQWCTVWEEYRARSKFKLQHRQQEQEQEWKE